MWWKRASRSLPRPDPIGVFIRQQNDTTIPPPDGFAGRCVGANPAAAHGIGAVNARLTLPLKLNLHSNAIFQSFR
jgi:hypothetical protein